MIKQHFATYVRNGTLLVDDSQLWDRLKQFAHNEIFVIVSY